MLRIFDADYQTLCLIDWFTSLSAKISQSYLSKRYLEVYIPEFSPMFMFQASAGFKS